MASIYFGNHSIPTLKSYRNINEKNFKVLAYPSKWLRIKTSLQKNNNKKTSLHNFYGHISHEAWRTQIIVKKQTIADKLHTKSTAMGKYSLEVQPKV